MYRGIQREDYIQRNRNGGLHIEEYIEREIDRERETDRERERTTDRGRNKQKDRERCESAAAVITSKKQPSNEAQT